MPTRKTKCFYCFCGTDNFLYLLMLKSSFIKLQLEHSEILCSALNAFMFFVWISEQTAIISLYSINLSVSITIADSVYCTVGAGSSNQSDTDSSKKGSTSHKKQGKDGQSLCWGNTTLHRLYQIPKAPLNSAEWRKEWWRNICSCVISKIRCQLGT